jgi:signal peptidase II
LAEVVVRTKWFWFSLWLVVGLVLDQASKAWVQHTLAYDRSDEAAGLVREIPVIDGWLSFVHAHNTGAAFSMMEGMHYLFLVFTVVATLVVCDMLRRLPLSATFQGGVLGLLISGAWGNGIDRVRFGYVIDFVRVYTEKPEWREWLVDTFGTNTYPIFNVADAALLIGVGLFAIQSFMMNDDDDDDALVTDTSSVEDSDLETEEDVVQPTEETEVIEP